MRYRVLIEYFGIGFKGWQKQKDQSTIQGEIEIAIFRFSNESVEVYGAGRTDAGVHALGQVAHFDLKQEFESHVVQNAINHHLGKNMISILSCETATEDFHARFSAIGKRYRYDILNRKAPAAILKDRVWHIPRELDIENMKAASEYLIGTHDFTSFRNVHCQSKSPIRTIDKITITKNEEIISIEVAGQSFLHNQIRIIVGTLVRVGLGSIIKERVLQILEARDRQQAAETAPPFGLYLLEVMY